MIDIIGFYPGGGGNRYLRYINNIEYSRHNVTYDSLVYGQKFINRYLLNGIGQIDNNVILTHCLNETHIKSVIGNCNITFLKTNFKKSLHREWNLIGHSRYKSDNTNIRLEHYNAIKDTTWPEVANEQEFLLLPERIRTEVDLKYKELNHLIDPTREYQRLITAFETISWHDAYYKQYPYQQINSKIIDIDIDDSDFANIMRRELNIDIDPCLN